MENDFSMGGTEPRHSRPPMGSIGKGNVQERKYAKQELGKTKKLTSIYRSKTTKQQRRGINIWSDLTLFTGRLSPTGFKR